MRKKTLLWGFTLGLLVTLMAAGSVFAAGFALYEGSARGNVLGAGLTATADDPSAIFYNPAGITQLKGKQMMVGLTAINPALTVNTTGQFVPALTPTIAGTTVQGNDMSDNWFFPPHAYFTQQISDKLYWGAGIFSRFGLGTEFDPAWPGRYNSYQATIQTVELNPNVAYKISDSFSIAAGFNVMWMDVVIKKQIDTRGVFGGDTNTELTGDSVGWGFNLAAHYKPLDWFSAGITYRSRVSQRLEGEISLSPNTPALRLVNQNISGDVRLPDEIFAGVNFKALKNLSIGGGVYWTRWSTYDKLQFKFEQPFGPTGAYNSTTAKEWEDVFRYMIGVEWAVTNSIDLRLSYAYDETPVPDNTISYELADSDRQMFSIGFGYHRDKWAVDLSYTYILFMDRDIAARPADYVLQGNVENGDAHLIGASFSYKF